MPEPMTLLHFARNALKWIPDLIALPTRVRVLVEREEASSDPRPLCRRCGTGRVIVLGVQKNPGAVWSYMLGKCENCGQLWQITENCSELVAARSDP